MKRTAAFLLILALALALAGCGGKESVVPKTVATVDGKPVSGDLYYEYLSMAWGRQVLPLLVEQQILLNWADSEKVPVTDAQVDDQIKIMKRDGTFDDQVQNTGSEQAVKDRYRELQARINLSEKFNKFTDDELMTLYNNPGIHRRYVHGPRKRVVVIVSTDSKKIADAEKAIKNGMDFDAAAAKYSDSQFLTQGPPKTFVEKGQGPPALWGAAESLKMDGVSKPFSFTIAQMGTLNALLKVIGEQPKADLSFAKVKTELRAMAALQKTMDPGFQKKLEDQKKKAEIKIDMPQYKYLVDQIKNPPPAMGMGQMMPPGARPGPAPKPGQ